MPELRIEGGGRAYQVAVQRFAADERSGAAVDPFFEQITEALAFAGGFEIMKPEAFLEPTQTVDYGAAGIPCDNWKASGANILLQGQLLRPAESDRQRVLYRVWDVDLCRLRGEPGILEGPASQLSILARRAADEIVRRFTGRRGVSSTQIAFVSDQSGNKEIYVMEAVDGSRRRRVTSNGSINLFPGWSSDANRLVYTSYRGGSADLWMLGRGRVRGGPLLALDGRKYKGTEKYRAVFGPRSDEVTFVMDRAGNTDIYVSEPGGRDVRRLTRHRAIDLSPSWSPDGKRLAFVSDRTGTPQIYILEVETGAVRRITYRGNYNATPAWSPTGEWIVYAARTGLQNLDLYLVDPDSLYTAPLVLHPRVDQDPAWSPDGRKIAFASNRRGRREIYVVDLDGRNLVRLTRSFGNCTSPAWASWLD